jgi:3-oxoadipate enol-lactonase
LTDACHCRRWNPHRQPGQGDGDPLVLLAGQANNHHWWDPVREDFDTSRTTITLDYRGTGGSDKPDEPYSTQGFADDVVAVLDDLGVERADVYGTSMGGRVARWLAVRHPDRIGTLVLGRTSPAVHHARGSADARPCQGAAPDRRQAA